MNTPAKWASFTAVAILALAEDVAMPQVPDRFDDDGPPWPRQRKSEKLMAKIPPGFLRARNLTGPGKGRGR
jgi:hypothetical protein